MKPNDSDKPQIQVPSRRDFLGNVYTAMMGIGLADLISGKAIAKGGDLQLGKPHFPAKAKRGIYLFMSGAPSQLDMYDYKPQMKTMFDKQLSLRMGQCNVKRWTDDLLPLVEDPRDPLGVMDLVTHRAPLSDAPALYETFQKKEDGCIKVVLDPTLASA